MVESLPVVVEICDRVQESVTDALKVQRLVRITDIEAFCDQARREELSTLTMSADVENGVFVFAPHVGAARHTRSFESPRHRFNVVVGENAKRRNDIFGE